MRRNCLRARLWRHSDFESEVPTKRGLVKQIEKERKAYLDLRFKLFFGLVLPNLDLPPHRRIIHHLSGPLDSLHSHLVHNSIVYEVRDKFLQLRLSNQKHLEVRIRIEEQDPSRAKHLGLYEDVFTQNRVGCRK